MSSQQDQIQQYLICGDNSLDQTNNPPINKKTKKRHERFAEDDNYGETKMDNQLKKLMHRDIERQRRQQMANLYASLRTLLPIEYIKGKRAISDHMHEAANYIRQLQTSIKELNLKREKLKLSDSTSVENKWLNRCSSSCEIRVNTSKDGVEILMITKPEYLPTSRLLHCLLQEGLHVIDCTSTTHKETSIHRIHSEVGDKESIDVVALQQKLADMINNDFFFRSGKNPTCTTNSNVS